MAQRRVQEAEGTGADQLVSCCPFCYQGLNVGITALESQLVMRDISALVAESLLGYDVFERAAQKAASQAEDKKARQAARKEARAQKKAALQVVETEDRQTPPASESDTTMDSASDSRTSVEEDPKRLKKAERERKRAEKRAARNREKALRREGRGDDAEKTSDAAKEMVAEAPKDADADGVDLTPVKNNSVTEPAASDAKTEKERRRAEKRAAREKEKAARRAAREK
jgi:hypothetical protein